MNLGFLLTYDAPPSAYYAGGAFQIQWLEGIIQNMTVQKNVEVILITDACHAGKLAGSSINGTQAAAQTIINQFANASKILSCQPDELSQEGAIWGGGHSVFTYYLIDGLIGLADENHDKKVTLLEIQQFLQKMVPPEVAPNRQVPIVSGNITKEIAKVDPPSLEALKKLRNLSGDTQKSEEIASTTEKAAEFQSGDSLTMALYKSFKRALKAKKLLYPKDSSAYSYFQKLKTKPDAAKQLDDLRNDLAAALQDEAQQAINAYLAASPEELHRRWSYDSSFQLYPEYLAKAAELLGPTHFSYTDLKAKQLYFEGLNIRLKAEQENNDDAFNNAEQRQELALTLSPNAAYAFNELGLLSRRKKDYERGLGYFEKAIELSPTWVLAQTNTCTAYLDVDKWDSAIDHCRLAINSDSSFALAWHNLGVAYYGKNDLKQATDCFQKAILVDPHLALPYYKLGFVYYRQNDYDKAEESWQNYLKETPAGTKNIDVLRTWNNLASLAAERKNFDSAINLYNKATEIDPDYPHAYYGKAQVLATMGKNDEALTTLKTALDKGYKRKNNLLKDWEFEELRKSPQFNELMKQYFPE